ncbi:hypothetical protein ACH5A3_18760 [Streptomyces echinatus]|uniref:hypothetical protein n=1 Tax=Streptomyces echinatus TaxID=67293 RepID=UPI0037B7F506
MYTRFLGQEVREPPREELDAWLRANGWYPGRHVLLVDTGRFFCLHHTGPYRFG